jgi:hypothetical protein
MCIINQRMDVNKKTRYTFYGFYSKKNIKGLHSIRTEKEMLVLASHLFFFLNNIKVHTV